MKKLGGNETMTSKERVLGTFAYQETDRVAINYHSNPGIDSRLKEHFGLESNDGVGLQEALGVDFRGAGPHYKGEVLHKDFDDRKLDPHWGWHTRYVEHDSGGYWDYCDFPLRDAGVDEVAAWPMPNPDDYDYSVVAERCEKNKEFGCFIGNAGLACIINTAGFLRNMEQVFIDLATGDEAGMLMIDRMMEVQYETTKRTLEAAADGIDFIWIGEDLGTQNGPIISMKTFQEHIKPRHKRFLDLANEYGKPVMIHTCGSSSWSYEEYIEMGLKAVDTLQPEATNMSPRYLKDTFGGRLCFHGCISTAGPVAYGTVDDVVEDVKQTLDIMMPGGGYFLSPTHSLQDNSPTENVVAMYEAAHEFGRY